MKGMTTLIKEIITKFTSDKQHPSYANIVGESAPAITNSNRVKPTQDGVPAENKTGVWVRWDEFLH